MDLGIRNKATLHFVVPRATGGERQTCRWHVRSTNARIQYNDNVSSMKMPCDPGS